MNFRKYNYCENNPKEMMRYLKLYIDQDIKDTFKKRQLMVSKSCINSFVHIKPPKDAQIINELLTSIFSS